MPSVQTLIPVIRTSRKQVLGAITLPGFFNFVGTETTVNATSGQAVPLTQWFPDNRRDGKRPWFMAYLVNETTFRSHAWRHYTDFLYAAEMNPVVNFSSPSTMPNLQQEVMGTLMTMLNSESQPSASVVIAPASGSTITRTRNVATDTTPVAVANGGSITSVTLTSGVLPAGFSALSIQSGKVRLNGTPTAAAGTTALTMTLVTTFGTITGYVLNVTLV